MDQKGSVVCAAMSSVFAVCIQTCTECVASGPSNNALGTAVQLIDPSVLRPVGDANVPAWLSCMLAHVLTSS